MLLNLRDVFVRFADEPVLDRVNLSIHEDERLCLTGRNGAGKSTLLRVLSGQIAPDEGEIVRRDNLRISLLDQDIPPDMDGTVYEIVTHGLGAIGHQLLDYERAASTGTEGWQTAIT